MHTNANIEGSTHPLEEAGKTLEHLEKISASEMTDQQKRAFELAKRNFSTHIEAAKKNLALMSDASDDTSRIVALEEKFSKIAEKFDEKNDARIVDKKAHQRAVLGGMDSAVPLDTEEESDEEEDEDMTIEDNRTYRKPLTEAYKAFNEKNYAKAMSLFDKAAELAKGLKRMGVFAEGIFMKSRCLFDQDKFPEARKAFEGVENNTKNLLASEDVPQYYFGAIVRKALCAYNLKDNVYAAKIFLDEKLMEKALPYEDAPDQAAVNGVIADLKERMKKTKISRG